MQPLIHRYNQDINSETTNNDTYCLVSAEALLFLLLENNYDYWVADLKNKNKSNKNGGDGVKTNSDDDVSEIVQQSDVYQMLVKQGVVHDEKMNAIKLHLKEQLNGKNDTYYF